MQRTKRRAGDMKAVVDEKSEEMGNKIPAWGTRRQMTDVLEKWMADKVKEINLQWACTGMKRERVHRI